MATPWLEFSESDYCRDNLISGLSMDTSISSSVF